MKISSTLLEGFDSYLICQKSDEDYRVELRILVTKNILKEVKGFVVIVYPSEFEASAEYEFFEAIDFKTDAWNYYLGKG